MKQPEYSIQCLSHATCWMREARFQLRIPDWGLVMMNWWKLANMQFFRLFGSFLHGLIIHWLGKQCLRCWAIAQFELYFRLPPNSTLCSNFVWVAYGVFFSTKECEKFYVLHVVNSNVIIYLKKLVFLGNKFDY